MQGHRAFTSETYHPASMATSAAGFDWVVKASLFDHGEITLRKAHCHQWLRETLGPMDRESRPVEIVNVMGTSLDGRIRQGETHGNEYYLLESRDPEFADGLREGQRVRVELRREEHGVVAYLDPPPIDG